MSDDEIETDPFATRLLTAPGHPDLYTHALRFGFYALLQVLESAVIFAMLAHILTHGLAVGTPRRMAIDIGRQSFNLIIGFGVSIPFFFVTTYAWVLWFALPRWWRGGATVGAGVTGRPGGHGARVTQPPVATGRAGSATQLDQEPT